LPATRVSRVWQYDTHDSGARAVAEFLASPVDDVARKHGRAVVADVLAAAVAGSAAPGVAGVARDGAFVDGKASILGTDRRVAPPQAAMTNAAAAIAQEIEEGHNTGATSVPGSSPAGSPPRRRTTSTARRSSTRVLGPTISVSGWNGRSSR